MTAPPSLVAPSIIKGDMPATLVIEILADSKDVFLARDAVAVSPQLRASRSHFEIKPSAIG